MDKNPFLLTAEDLKKIALNYDSSKFSISYMNEWQKYKNPYSRVLIKAKNLCKYFEK